MEIANINPDLLKQTLRAWQTAEPLPAIWHTCDALPPHHRRPAELSHHLYDLLQTIALNKRRHYQTAENLPHLPPSTTRIQAIAALTADFAPQNSELSAWSALYHRHLSDISLTAEAMATAVTLTPRHINRHIERGITRLTEELQRLEMAAHHTHQTSHRQRHLPPANHHHLFGVDRLVDQVTEWAKDDAMHPMLSLEGMGGIGKTTAARAAVAHLATQPHWADIFWVSAQQNDLDLQHGRLRPITNAPTLTTDIVNRLANQMGYAHLAGLSTAEKLHQLHPACQNNPYLIIIDNLETVDDLNNLIPHLTPLAKPTRFLLTSRHTLSGYGSVKGIPVPNLNETDSYALIQSELGRRSRPFILAPAEMQRIYTLIGGLPLALKLLAAQLGKLPLVELLTDIASLSKIEMYTFIYQRSWDSLSDSARQLLVSLHDISADGADLGWIEYMADLDTQQFSPALSQLLDCSLLETDGDLQNPTYHLHRLTATFLRSQILDQWGG